MPVNAFGGTHGWGYDGVLWYAVHEPYGGPDGLVRFDRRLPPARPRCADRRGVQPPRPVGQLPAEVRAVPVVGQQPVGRSRSTSPTRTPTRCAATSSTARCGGCATSTPTVCGSTPCTRWSTPPPSTSSRRLPPKPMRWQRKLGRPLSLIAESDRNDPRLITPRDHGGYGMTAQWDDDIHHAIHAAVSGERQGYYADFGSLETLAQTLKHGYFHAGHVLVVPAPPARPSAGHDDHSGDAAAGLHPDARPGRQPRASATGRRRTSDFGQLAVKAALALGSPYTAMLFMGEEWGSSITVPVLQLPLRNPSWPERPPRAARREFAEHGWEPTRSPIRRIRRRSNGRS